MRGTSVRVVHHKGVTYPMGRWAASEAGGAAAFDDLPAPQAPASDAPPQAFIDYQHAVWASQQLLPLWRAYIEMPKAVEQVLQEERALETRGYTGEALRDAMVIIADRGFAILKRGATEAYYLAKVIREKTVALSSTFKEPTESEARQAALDLALAQRFIGLDPAGRARWLVAGDDRSLAALVRLPASLTTLKPDELALLHDSFMERMYPQTAEAFEQLTDILYSPRMAASEGARAIARAAGRDPNEEISSWGEAGSWVRSSTANMF